MYTGALSPKSNKAGWTEVIEVTDSDTGDAVDLPGATIVFELVDTLCDVTALSATTDNGQIVIIDVGVFQVAFTATNMKTLCARTYRVGCTISNADSEPQQFIIGTVPVLDGVVSK